MLNKETHVEDGCLGGLKDNRHASKFKQRREHSIENWEDDVEYKQKALEEEKQKLYFAQVEVIDNRLDSLLKIQNNVRLIKVITIELWICLIYLNH